MQLAATWRDVDCLPTREQVVENAGDAGNSWRELKTLCSLVPSFWSIVRLRLREVRPRKSPRSGTGLWHPAWKLVKSRPMGSPPKDGDAGSNPTEGATTNEKPED